MTIADVNQEIRDLCDADSTSLTDATLLRRVNSAMEEVVGKIINADGTWEFDDTNYSDSPVGTGDLVAGQSAYSFAAEYLDIEWIKVKKADGNWYLISPIDQSQTDYPLEQDLVVNGLPYGYDKEGDTIRLYPAPATSQVTLTGGLKVKFKRTASLFTTAIVNTGTQAPGIASPYHILLCYMAALPYCMSYKKDRVALYQQKIIDLTKDMIEFYGNREKDKHKIMQSARVNFI